MGYTRPDAYTIAIGFGAWSPGDGTTNYFNGFQRLSPTTTQGQYLIYINKSGFIRSVTFYAYAVTAAGTAEAWPLSVRKNNTTDYAIASVSTVGPGRLWANYSLNIPVAAGDYLEMKYVNPTWVTNPDGVTAFGTILIESE